MTNNLLFYERFSGTIGSWTLDQSGGSASIAVKDYSNKLELNNTNSGLPVSATRTFAEPSGKWVLEYDINVASGAIGVAELLDASNNVIATVDCGSTADTVSFSTDTVAASTAAFTAGTYKQIILVLDNAANTIKASVSEDDTVYGSIRQVGASKGYSGTAIAKIRFRSGAGATGIVYIDEVKVYTPDIFIIGDSITDGKLYWSTHPGYIYYGGVTSGRITQYVDETSSPGYQLSQKLGPSVWVANRAFGGSQLADIDAKIQTAVLDHNPRKVYIAAGRNDMGATPSLSSMLASLNSIITKVQNAGITGKNILLANTISANGANSKVTEWNTWVRNKAQEIGAVFVDMDAGMTDPANPDYGNPAYLDTVLINDGVHFNPTGSVEIARIIQGAIYASDYASQNVLRVDPGVNEERLFAQVNIASSITLNGNAAVTSTVSGALSISTAAVGLSGSVAGQSSVSGVAGLLTEMSGFASGLSSISGRSFVIRNFSGVYGGVSALTGDLYINMPLGGVVPGLSSQTGTLTVLNGLLDLIGTIAGVSSDAVTVYLLRGLKGNMAGQMAATGFINATWSLFGALNGGSSASGIFKDSTVAGKRFFIPKAVPVSGPDAKIVMEKSSDKTKVINL